MGASERALSIPESSEVLDETGGVPAAALRGVACPDPNPEVALVLPDAAETYTFGVLAGVTIPEPRRVDGGGPGRSSEVLRTEYILDGNEIGGFGKINKGTEVAT